MKRDEMGIMDKLVDLEQRLSRANKALLEEQNMRAKLAWRMLTDLQDVLKEDLPTHKHGSLPRLVEVLEELMTRDREGNDV